MSTLPEHIKNVFKEALAQVPQRILWKYEGEMKDMPKNVMTKKWFPQRDILCKIIRSKPYVLLRFLIGDNEHFVYFLFCSFAVHPNVKLFISHGGISGVYETVDAGVPVLGFPLFYDQHRNIANLVEAGMAITMELMSVSTNKFLSSVLELINNKK